MLTGTVTTLAHNLAACSRNWGLQLRAAFPGGQSRSSGSSNLPALGRGENVEEELDRHGRKGQSRKPSSPKSCDLSLFSSLAQTCPYPSTSEIDYFTLPCVFHRSVSSALLASCVCCLRAPSTRDELSCAGLVRLNSSEARSQFDHQPEMIELRPRWPLCASSARASSTEKQLKLQAEMPT